MIRKGDTAKDHIARFWRKVMLDDSTKCWLWTGATGGGGYGNVNTPQKMTSAHRIAYEYIKGPIPEGFDVDHTCRVRLCCNPAHLEAVTRAENLRRRPAFLVANARKITCREGHPFDRVISTSGERYCSICHRAKDRRQKERARMKQLLPDAGTSYRTPSRGERR